MRKKRQNKNRSRLLRLAAGVSGGLAGAVLGTGGQLVFNNSVLLFTVVGAILGLMVLEAALRLPSPFQQL